MAVRMGFAVLIEVLHMLGSSARILECSGVFKDTSVTVSPQASRLDVPHRG